MHFLDHHACSLCFLRGQNDFISVGCFSFMVMVIFMVMVVFMFMFVSMCPTLCMFMGVM